MKTLLLASVFASVLASNPLNVVSSDTSSQADWFRFVAQPGPLGQQLERPLMSATGGAGSMAIRAEGLSTPYPCQKLSGAAERKGKKVTVRVTIHPLEGGCIATLGNFRYEATVNNLTPGKYQVEVIHKYPGTGWSGGTVFKRKVNVR